MARNTPSLISHYARQILDALPDGVFISDASGQTLYINHTYEEVTGIRLEHVEGKNVRLLVKEGIFDHVLNPEIVKTGKPATHVQTLKNGMRLVLSGFPVFDANGEVCLVVTFARDITLLSNLQERVAEQHQLIDHMKDQLVHMSQGGNAGEPVFQSAEMLETITRARCFAATDATVLVLGETGVGKDVMGRMLHNLSNRKDKIFLKVDCGGISESLTESELFGYQPGAFTGASSKGKAGYFEIADGGTIFLDEIGELPLTMQTRLLRVLQDGEIVRIGSTIPRKIDARVIAATNRDLAQCVEEGTFRRDLYYRLNVASVRIPPLRERPDDIAPLAQHFLRMYCGKYHKVLVFMDITLDLLRTHPWPGNVRELQNMVHTLAITLPGPLIAPGDLPFHLGAKKNISSVYPDIFTTERPLKDIMADMERDFLTRAVEVHGSIQKVAKMFNVSRTTIFRKLKNARDGAE